MCTTNNKEASLMKITHWISILILLWSGVSTAADEHPAQVLMEQNTSEVLQILADNSDRIKTDEAFLRETIDTYFTPNLDFLTMTKLAVGKTGKKRIRLNETRLSSNFANCY